jgi:hypothetical protein
VVVAASDAPSSSSLLLPVSTHALDDLQTPRLPAVQDLGWTEIEGQHWPVPVGRAGPSVALGDLVAAAAWWLAGVQEHAIPTRDRHGRVPFAETLQAALGDAPGGPLSPAVDAYRARLGEVLLAHGIDTPGRTWGGAPWAVALTHDLDAVRTRRLRAFAGDLSRGRPIHALRRALGPDRRRASIDALYALSARHGATTTWFVKPGAWTPEDIPGGLDAWVLDRLRRWEGEGHEVGWHPGYGTHGHPGRWATERTRFEEAVGHPPMLARTHFLRWAEPATPRRLHDEGIRLDSTLGFAEHEGFRRGTAHPFRVFDLEADRMLTLWEMPLAVMDTTLTDYRRIRPDAVAARLEAVCRAARRHGGVAVVLWHNQLDADTGAWQAGLEALDHALGHARLDGARIGPLNALLDGWRGT